MTPVTHAAGRSVALFGLGGSGIVTAQALAAGGAHVVCWDDTASSRDKALAAEHSLRESETAVRRKLATLLEPEGGLGDLAAKMTFEGCAHGDGAWPAAHDQRLGLPSAEVEPESKASARRDDNVAPGGQGPQKVRWVVAGDLEHQIVQVGKRRDRVLDLRAAAVENPGASGGHL